MGNFIDNLPPGAKNLRHVNMSNELRNYFPAVRQRLYGEQSSLFSFPEVALTRILSLRLSKEDGFMIDVFGLIVLKYVSLSDNSTSPMRLHGKGVFIRKPRNDQWLPVLTIDAQHHSSEIHPPSIGRQRYRDPRIWSTYHKALD